MDDAEKEKLFLFNKEYEQFFKGIESIWKGDKDFKEECVHILGLSGEEKQKYIDSHPRIKELQDRKREMKRKYGIEE